MKDFFKINLSDLIKKNLLFFLLLLILTIIFSYKLTEIPPGINGDEASIGLNSILLSKSLRDETGSLLPFFILTLEGQDWKQPVTIYSTAIAFFLFGKSFFVLRAASLFFLLISFILMYLLVKKIYSNKYAIVGVLIFASSPILMIQSHLALENISVLPFVIFWLLMLVKFQKVLNNKYLLFAGISLGLGLYSYNGMRLIVPALFILTLFFILYLVKINLAIFFRSLSFLVAGLFPFIIIIPWLNIRYPGALLGNNQLPSDFSFFKFMLPYISSFDLSFLYLKGDSTAYHSTGKHGIFLLATLPLFLLGIFNIVRRKKIFEIFTLATFLLTPIFYGFTDVIHRGSRLLVLIPAYTLICLMGFELIYNLREGRRKFLIFLITLFLVINYLDFISDYWFFYPGRVKEYFKSDSHITFSKLYQRSKERDQKPIIQENIYARDKVAALFFDQVYFDGKLAKWELKDLPPDQSVVLGYSNLDNFKTKNYKEERIGNTIYSLYIKN